MKVKIKRLDPSLPLPEYHTKESAGFDIASAIDVTVQPNEVVKIPTGLVIESPTGHFLLIAARSSLPSKKGLAIPSGVGIVDPDYAGPSDQVHIIVINFTSQPVTVTKGERLAQGIFLPIEQAQWEEVNTIRESDRGGIGSTGGYS